MMFRKPGALASFNIMRVSRRSPQFVIAENLKLSFG